MNFDNNKKTFLAKIDRSRKGSIDQEIISLVKLINSKKNYYTTSSCSGRIVLIKKRSEKKQDAEWLFVSHKKVKPNQIKDAIKNI